MTITSPTRRDLPMKTPRRSYEARVLLVPLGPDAVRIQQSIREHGLDRVMTIDSVAANTGTGEDADRFRSYPLAEQGWRAETNAQHVGELVDGADMVVLLASDLGEMPHILSYETAAAAREAGTLIAALVIGEQKWDTPECSSAMAALREAVDMLVVVKGVALAAAFLDTLPGGRPQVPVL